MINLSSKQKGNLTELQSITAFYKLGYQVSIPYGENSRYDFIADINGKLIKVQCKTSREIDTGVIELKNILGEKELAPTQEEINACLENFGTQEENYTAARKTAISKKYDDMIEKLCKEADVQK